MRYNTYGCGWIASSSFHINGMMSDGVKCVGICCEGIDNIPNMTFEKTPEETFRKYRRLHKEVLRQGKGQSAETSYCKGCPSYQEGKFEIDGKIHYINLSMYPSPCQCKCFYCDFKNNGFLAYNREKHAPLYDRLFETLEYAMNSGTLAPDCYYQVSCGEITIHPYKERIFRLIKNKPAMFYTNAFIFDDQIAEALRSNLNSSINLSIDSGTSSSWAKIKGCDNFEEVKANLICYKNNSARPGQITLKYIILPGINDTPEDYFGIIAFMKHLEVSHLTLSLDGRTKYSATLEARRNLIHAAGHFIALLHKANITFNAGVFLPNDLSDAVRFAQELLNTNGMWTLK